MDHEEETTGDPTRQRTELKARPAPTMTVLARAGLRRQRPGHGLPPGVGQAGTAGCPGYQPAQQTEGAGQANFVQSVQPHSSRHLTPQEHHADIISQDPIKYSRLRAMAATGSCQAQSYLNLADECREQRWIELERVSVHESQSIREHQQGRCTTPKTPKHRADQDSSVATLRAVRQALAQAEDERPLLPMAEEASSGSD